MSGKKHKDYNELDDILRDIQANQKVQEMKGFVQHGKVSTYEHCENVAKLSYSINRKLSLHSDLNVLLIGAMLHDFYLYDWHDYDNGEHLLHGFTHPEAARANAKKYFGIDDRTGKVISTHMWPFNPVKIPTSREGWIICIADKYVSLHETIFRRQRRQVQQGQRDLQDRQGQRDLQDCQGQRDLQDCQDQRDLQDRQGQRDLQDCQDQRDLLIRNDR